MWGSLLQSKWWLHRYLARGWKLNKELKLELFGGWLTFVFCDCALESLSNAEAGDLRLKVLGISTAKSVGVFGLSLKF